MQNVSTTRTYAFTALAFAFLFATTLGIGGCAVDLDASATTAEQDKGRVQRSRQNAQEWLKWHAFHCSKLGPTAKLEFNTDTGVARCFASMNGEAVREIWQVQYVVAP